ncbi:MAG: HupE/UreJ family protein [Sphingomonas sp.]|uniref:HupE/UreJ family protein n=1 Tax=Sphingomonas sp. TaxID=28214 RepID=UPI0025EF025F|nr:HupE/UreJ family protein [Sphingomonas sp.]MBX3563544.1 HupE/UreJ family protein [Sphingomonas sp.]
MIRALIRCMAILTMLTIGGMPPADAHTRSTSHSAWTLDGRLIHMSFAVADVEVARLARNGEPVSDAALTAYLAGHVGVSANGAPCGLTAPPKKVSTAPGMRRIEFQYACPSAEAMRLTSTAFLDVAPAHINFAQVQRPDGEFVEQIMDASAPAIDLDEAGGGTLGNASFFKFIEMGIMHIFTGIDHMAFLLGLVLISRRLRDLVFVVTGFTIGHSLTLALAVTGIIRPHAEFIDALVALTIALIGAENIALAARRPALVALWTGGTLAAMAALRLAGIGVLPPLLLIGAAIFSANYLMVSGYLKDAGRLRLVVTLVFGLIHGFGFAADLLESRLPPEKLAEILVGFNLGVEIGQLSVVLAVATAAMLLVRAKLAPPRAITVDLAASALVAVGVFWFVGRSFVA